MIKGQCKNIVQEMKAVSSQMKGPPHTSQRMKTDLHGGNPYDISKHRREKILQILQLIQR